VRADLERHAAPEADPVSSMNETGPTEEIALHAQPTETVHFACCIDPVHLHDGREDIELGHCATHVFLYNIM
jgi:hypothetical protein